MDAIGQPLRLEGVHESAAVQVGDGSGIVVGGHGAGSDPGARSKHAAAADARAFANQSRGVGDLAKASAMQAAAGVDECFGAARAGARREQIRRSKAASACSLQGTVAEKAADACEELFTMRTL